MIQQFQSGAIIGKGRTFERIGQDGQTHFFQKVSVLDRYAEIPTMGKEGKIAITHEVEIEVDPPQNPNSY